MRPALLPVLLLSLIALPAHARGLTLDIEIPRLSVAEYHRPYIAVWIESTDRRSAASLAVWYDVKMANREGEKWLKDLRQWWRRDGRALTLPADAISSATRPPGRHSLQIDIARAPFDTLAPGEYVLQVEAAREVGGREVLSLPFRWPLQEMPPLAAHGTTELGEAVLQLTP